MERWLLGGGLMEGTAGLVAVDLEMDGGGVRSERRVSANPGCCLGWVDRLGGFIGAKKRVVA